MRSAQRDQVRRLETLSLPRSQILMAVPWPVKAYDNRDQSYPVHSQGRVRNAGQPAALRVWRQSQWPWGQRATFRVSLALTVRH